MQLLCKQLGSWNQFTCIYVNTENQEQNNGTENLQANLQPITNSNNENIDGVPANEDAVISHNTTCHSTKNEVTMHMAPHNVHNTSGPSLSSSSSSLFLGDQ